jgi:hypothetical protein
VGTFSKFEAAKSQKAKNKTQNQKIKRRAKKKTASNNQCLKQSLKLTN